MSSRARTIRKRRVSLEEATLDDLIYLTCERTHRVICDACQLIEQPTQQHALVLNLICNMINAASYMLGGGKGMKDVRAKKLAATMVEITRMLSALEER